MTPAYAYHEEINWALLRLWGERKGLDLLDLGCGFGTTSGRIQALGNRVTGVEADPGAAGVAQARLGRVIQADLMDLEAVEAALGEARFDVILFADVLEHLPAPSLALTAYLGRLRPGGRVLISLPNVGLWSVRLSLLAGRWNYADTGVLDRTHLRFFTLRTARALLAEAGVQVVGEAFNPGLVRPFIPVIKRVLAARGGGGQGDPQAILNSGAYKFYLRWIHPLERVLARVWPGALEFQMVLEGRPGDAKAEGPC